MRVTFASETAARAAASTLEQYGYTANQTGAALDADCPPLLAVPLFGRTVGFDKIEKIHFDDGAPRRASAPRRSTAGVSLPAAA
jgi:hypothetical protein